MPNEDPAKRLASTKKKAVASSAIKMEGEAKESNDVKKEGVSNRDESPEESEDDGSEDDYVEEPASKKSKSSAGRVSGTFPQELCPLLMTFAPYSPGQGVYP